MKGHIVQGPKFGTRLANERRRLGHSQDEFAEIISIGRSGYAAIEGDRAPLDVSRLCQLGEIAGVDILYVMTGERAAVAATDFMDWPLLDAILKGLHEQSVLLGIQIPIHKQCIAVKSLYQSLSPKGCFDAQAITDVLRLVEPK